MKKIGFAINHYKQKTDFRFVVLSADGEIEKFPQNVKLRSISLYDIENGYLFSLLYADGRTEYYIEDTEREDVLYLDEMDNAEQCKPCGDSLIYLKSGNWFNYNFGNQDELLGQNLLERVFARQDIQNGAEILRITQIGSYSGDYTIVTDRIIKAKSSRGEDIVLAHRIGMEPNVYYWIDGQSSALNQSELKFGVIEQPDGQLEPFDWFYETGILKTRTDWLKEQEQNPKESDLGFMFS